MTALPPRAPFVPPPYPYDRLVVAQRLASAHPGGAVDLSIGTPFDPPPKFVVDALANSGAERGYPPSVGTKGYLEAAAAWMERRLAVEVPIEAIAACVGTKELVVGLPAWLRLRYPDRDVVLCPPIAYPSYEMGATLSGCQAVPIPLNPEGRLDFSAIEEEVAARALVAWVNTPSNPTGLLEDLATAARWGRDHGVVVASDECYAEFTWSGPPRTILSEGTEGLLALHSLSKRSNMAGLRAGFYAGDPDLVHYLSEVRKHAGFMVPGPVQAAAIAAWGDDDHVVVQRDRYLERMDAITTALGSVGMEAPMPEGAFYIWASQGALDLGDDWAIAEWLAQKAGLVVAPGELYGDRSKAHVRIAAVQPIERLAPALGRLVA